jgi:hypothetical protein
MTISIVNNSDLVSFQGKLYEGIRDSNGLGAGFRWAGNASILKFALQQDEVDHKESYSGNRLIDGVLSKPGQATLSFTLDWLTKGNVELGLNSSQVSNAGTSVTGETQGTVAVGDFIFTKHGNISALVITDSAGSPGTLTLNTHYSIDDAAYGRIKILSLGSFTQPFKLAYTYAQEIIFPFFANSGLERYYRFEGLNTAVVPNKKVAFEFYRGKAKPFTEFGLIDEEFGKFPIEVRLLADATRAADTNFLQFGRYIPLE